MFHSACTIFSLHVHIYMCTVSDGTRITEHFCFDLIQAQRLGAGQSSGGLAHPQEAAAAEPAIWGWAGRKAGADFQINPRASARLC